MSNLQPFLRGRRTALSSRSGRIIVSAGLPSPIQSQFSIMRKMYKESGLRFSKKSFDVFIIVFIFLLLLLLLFAFVYGNNTVGSRVLTLEA